MIEKLNLLNNFRSLGFGGLLGSLVALIICIVFPQILATGISIYWCIGLGASLGAVLHRAIDTVLLKTILYPTSKFVTYYAKVFELEFNRKKGYISGEKYTYFKNVLDYEYFTNEDIRNNKLLNNPTSEIKNTEVKGELE